MRFHVQLLERVSRGEAITNFTVETVRFELDVFGMCRRQQSTHQHD